jgi:hypothetical protein
MLRTGVFSDENVRRFCKTVERDDSNAPLTDRLLATRGNRQRFARRLAEATYSPEQLAVLSPCMCKAMCARAAHVLTAPAGVEWEGFADYDEAEWGAFADYDDPEGEEWEGFADYEDTDAASFQFESLTPSAAGSSTDPLTPPSSSRRRTYTMKSSFSGSQEPVPVPIGKRLEFSASKDKGDISQPREPPSATVVSRAAQLRAARTRARMKNISREDLLELYEDAYWQAKNRPPPPLDDVGTEQLAADFLSLV